MNFFEHEMRVLFGDSELLSADTVFTGKTAIGKLDDDVRAKLQFTAANIANQYDAIKLTVINRKDGVIDSQLFRFSDIIGNKNGYNPHIWEDGSNISWYGYKPSAVEYDRISNTIQDYMAMFASEDMNYSGPSL